MCSRLMNFLKFPGHPFRKKNKMATVVAQVPPTAQVSQGLIPRVQSTALYVGDLRPEVNKNGIFLFFFFPSRQFIPSI